MVASQTIKLISDDGFWFHVDETFIRESHLLQLFAASNAETVPLYLGGGLIKRVITMANYVIYGAHYDVNTLPDNHPVFALLCSLRDPQLEELESAVDYLGMERLTQCIMQLRFKMARDEEVNRIAADLRFCHI